MDRRGGGGGRGGQDRGSSRPWQGRARRARPWKRSYPVQAHQQSRRASTDTRRGADTQRTLKPGTASSGLAQSRPLRYSAESHFASAVAAA